jgi:protein involved in polysaccharide export with SLBB domain
MISLVEAFLRRRRVFFLGRILSASLFFLMVSIMPLFCGCAAFLDWLAPGDKIEVDEFKPEYWEDGDPKIRSGLHLKIGVTASGSVTVEEALKEVDLNGEIVLPMIGTVKCGGLTVVALQEQIKAAYTKYFIDPQVSVSFVYNEAMGMKSPWGSVLVMGTVQRPGPVNMPPTRDLTVTRALMAAGNPTPLADKTRIRVSRREKSGKITRYFIDVVEIGQGGRTELDIQLKSGDVIWVPETWY